MTARTLRRSSTFNETTLVGPKKFVLKHNLQNSVRGDELEEKELLEEGSFAWAWPFCTEGLAHGAYTKEKFIVCLPFNKGGTGDKNGTSSANLWMRNAALCALYLRELAICRERPRYTSIQPTSSKIIDQTSADPSMTLASSKQSSPTKKFEKIADSNFSWSMGLSHDAELGSTCFWRLEIEIHRNLNSIVLVASRDISRYNENTKRLKRVRKVYRLPDIYDVSTTTTTMYDWAVFVEAHRRSPRSASSRPALRRAETNPTSC